MGVENNEVPLQEKVKNLDEYEREKIQTTLEDTKHLVEVIENYLKMLDECDKSGIRLTGRTNLDDIRREDGPAGPNNDILKLSRKFEAAMNEVKQKIEGK